MQRVQSGGAAASSESEEASELRRRAEASSALVEKLLAENDTLTELVNQQAHILGAIRAARLSAQPRGDGGVPADEDEEEGERVPEQEQPQTSSGGEDGEAASSPLRVPAPLPAEPARVATPEPPPAKQAPQRWMLGRIWAHVAGYDNAPQRSEPRR